MTFPSEEEFLAAFGVEPAESDLSVGSFLYVFEDCDGPLKAMVSFNAVERSFQVRLLIAGRDVIVVSSEKVESLRIHQDRRSSSLRAIFDIDGIISEAEVIVSPALSCRWWALER
ncbi:hypothetical protein RUR49_19790 [Pseudoxanthobacter sp. M-2]|uniref:hypothetical protein n=1 Tax=Pseudoxanthobacter sp. M-2 TaxID=3078754 RepID=UPI0038FC54AC